MYKSISAKLTLIGGIVAVIIGLVLIGMGTEVRQVSYNVQVPYEVQTSHEVTENKTDTLFTVENRVLDKGDYLAWNVYIPSGRDISFSLECSVDANETVITDDMQTTFWNLTNIGTGSIQATMLDSAEVKQKGEDSLNMTAGLGSYTNWEVYHVYASPQNWSSKEASCFYWYGSNTSSVFRVYSWSKGTVFHYDFRDQWIGWRRLLIPFENFTFTGNASLKEVDSIHIQQKTLNLQGTWFVDRFTLSVEPVLRLYVFTADQYSQWSVGESTESVAASKKANGTMRLLTPFSGNYTFVIHNYHSFENATVQSASANMTWQETTTEYQTGTEYKNETRYTTEEDYTRYTIGGVISVFGITFIVIGAVMKPKFPVSPSGPPHRFKYFRNNPGCIFIVAFQVLLLSAAAILILGLEALANDIAVYAYFSLVAGVIIQTIIVLKEKKSSSTESQREDQETQ